MAEGDDKRRTVQLKLAVDYSKKFYVTRMDLYSTDISIQFC